MAVTTANDIANMALDHLGELIVSDYTTGTDATSQAINRSFDNVRDMVLREHTWDFAVRIAELSASADGADDDWAYKYDLPTGSLRIIRLLNTTRTAVDYEYAKRHTTADDETVIVTDQEAAYVEFIYQETDVSKMSASFIDALAYRLAAHLVGPIAASASLRQEMMQYFQFAMTQARQLDSSEQRVDVQDNARSNYVTSRS